MRSGSALSLAVAVAFGGVAVLLARGLLPNGAESAAPPNTVVVAAAPIAFGAPLTPENLREVPWPKDSALDGAFAKVFELTRDGRRLALAPLGRNEPILAAKVTAPNGRATLSTQIDEGMRAVSVRVDEVRGVAGFVLPGDRVDVILTRGESGPSEAAAFADMLLQNVKVLAIDQLANDRQDKPAIARAVTLELTVNQAQKVVLAQGIGRLSLILRQAGEVEGLPAARVTAGDLGPVEVTGSIDRVSGLEKRLEELARANAAARPPQPDDGALQQRLSELEMRLRLEMSQKATAPSAPMPVAGPPASVVNVTRNGAKREQYTVTPER